MKIVNVNAEASAKAPDCTAPSPERLAAMLREQAEATKAAKAAEAEKAAEKHIKR